MKSEPEVYSIADLQQQRERHHRAKKGNLYARAETKMGQAFQDVISTIILVKKL